MPGGGIIESLADVAYKVIADRIITLEIRPNEPVNESQLSKEMQMGRTPIREALRRLEGEYLVVTRPRKGSFAAPVDLTDLSEVSQIRQILEPVAAGMAAENLRPGQDEELRRYLVLLESLDSRSVDQNELMRFDLAVHRLIYGLAGSRHLEDTLLRYAHLSTRIWTLVLERRPLVTEHVLELGAIIDSILAKDAERARLLMGEHVRNFNNYVTGIVSGATPPRP
ncbi:GntR family transcriptional regulator [Arthrobacter ginkgonis]|uniref:GntR family transcriptional regulator n=1 Tax=Arthrobacter ginkgonis TaxID=1630594 RepID=A0ABP7C7V4_9MICC